MTQNQLQQYWQRAAERHPQWYIGFWLMIGSLIATVLMERAVYYDTFLSLDQAVAQWFQDIKHVEVERRMLQLTALGSDTIITILSYVLISILFFRGKFRRAFLVFLCIMGAVALTFGMKELIDRPRPDIVEELFIKPRSSSFPSGHALISISFFLTIAWFIKPTLPTRGGRRFIMIFAVVLSIAIGISRLYLGVHYLTDVVAGWCAGLAWVSACWLLLVMFGHHPREGDFDNKTESHSNL